jgi:hypothetical protein
LGSTSTTVAVMEPVKVLVLCVLPWPLNLFSEPTSMVDLFASVLLTNGKVLMPPESEPVRSMSDEDCCLAVTFSTIMMVTVSPTKRARRSSNAGR